MSLALMGCGSDFTLEYQLPASLAGQGRALAETALVPVALDDGRPTWLPCSGIGTFTPLGRRRTGRALETAPRPVKIYANARVSTFEDPERLEIELEARQRDDNDPWAATLIHLAVLGEDDLPIAEGCSCVRAVEGHHPDQTLDQQVLENCTPIRPIAGQPGVEALTIVLDPIVAAPFSLSACEGDRFSAVNDQGPRVAACLRAPRCQAPGQSDCYECSGVCTDVDFSLAPIRFRWLGPDGALIEERLVRSDELGHAAVDFGTSCGQGGTVEVSILGDPRPPLVLGVACVAAPALRCGGTIPLGIQAQLRAPAIWPGLGGGDRVAVLGGAEAKVELYDGRGQRVFELSFPGELPLGVHGFDQRLGPEVEPILVVATAAQNALRLRIYRDEQGFPVLAQTLDGRCGAGRCGDVPCALPLQTAVGKALFSTADWDGDGRLDLAVSLYGQPQALLYETQGRGADEVYASACDCRGTALASAALAIADLGGDPEGRPELVAAGAGGVVLRYGDPANLGLGCGPTVNLGTVPLLDLVTAPLSCEPPAACPTWSDLAILEGEVNGRSSLEVIRGALSRYESGFDFEAAPGRRRRFELPEGARPIGMVQADANRDGAADLLVVFAGEGGAIGGWLGSGGAALAPLRPFGVAECWGACTPASPQAADLDGDGQPEIVSLCDPESPKARLGWLRTGAQP